MFFSIFPVYLYTTPKKCLFIGKKCGIQDGIQEKMSCIPVYRKNKYSFFIYKKKIAIEKKDSH
jgi:hypothetical protein